MEHKCVKDLIADIEALSKNAVLIIKEWGIEKENYIGVYITDDGHGSLFEVDVDADLNKIYLHWDIDRLSENFLVAVSRLAQALRHECRQPTSMEYLAFQFAYYCLSNGESLAHKHAHCLGTPGFRPHTQTYMSLTDPGEGHVLGTTRFNDWMKGAIIHVEHLERPRNLPRENIEFYRVPSIFDFAKVRLHVGPAAPTTYFVGRRVKDSGNFDEDFIKLVNITAAAAAATAAFFQGAAGCKVSMEGMTTSQAVRYMQALRAQVQRKKKQFLSAAWNLNQMIIDDYDITVPVELTQRMEIATRAIEITSIGGFNKVTRDEAAHSFRGRGVHLLARLDTMFFEGSISERQNRLRNDLFSALLTTDKVRVEDLIQELDEVVHIPDEGNEPLLGTAKRFLSTEEPMLKRHCETESEWKSFTKMLKSLVTSKDTALLYEEYDSDPWLSMRKLYRQKQMENKIITRQISFDVNCRAFRF
ncbi:hypothetical protein CHS0354_009862 [Potamilus streckersoni]|uniref:Uncharacterized protein n=1 Tax=Potamilus streckersoni TaxID=2493646 RepID=A0AAE0SW81_9BIVA|nr:hypothetical protein CHS0354_009862 [Potamilus streckersoni]